MSRRMTKTERELVADIHKTFTKFCNKNACVNCRYNYADKCEIEYIKELLELDDEEEEE